MPGSGEPSTTDRAARFRRLMELFEIGRGLAASERATWLDRECADDAALRGELAQMLARDQREDGAIAPGAGLRVLEPASSGGSVAGLDQLAFDAHQTPVLRGDYRVLRVIGEGGMGVVYEAQQAFPRRRVALKALHAGRASRRALLRFEQEAHILGRLQHSGIAQLYEAGLSNPESGDQAFLAMEFVDGTPLTQFALEHQLPLRARVELLAQVADAVQYAHQRRVIHRDLKPGNILVLASGVAKILDFGVARLADDDSAQESGMTAAGQLVGTLPYMSPEQVSGDAREVDARADVYALGVMLYQLLTERLPHPPEGRSMPQMLLAINNETPPAPRSLVGSIPRDVDAICMRALEKQRERRYQSAAEIAADLRRWLRGEPVSVRAESSTYVLTKFVQRNRVATALATLAALALAAFAVQSALSARREARNARDMSAALHLANLERGRLLAVSGDFALAERALWAEHLARPDVQSHWALWELYAKNPCSRSLSGHADTVLALACSADGARLASGAHDGSLALWNLADGAQLALEPRLTTAVSALEFAGPSSVVAFATDGALACFDAHSGARRWSLDADAAARCIACDPSGEHVAVGGVGPEIVLRDVATGVESGRVAGIESGARCLEYGLAGVRLAVGGAGGIVRVTTLESGSRASEFRVGEQQISALAFGASESTLLVGDEAGAVRIVAADTGATLTTLASACGSIRSLAIDARRERVLVRGDRGIAAFELATARPIELSPTLSQTLACVALTPDGEQVAAASLGGRIRVWSLDPHPGLALLASALPAGSSVALGPAAHWLAATQLDGALDLYRLPAGSLERHVAQQDSKVLTIAFDELQTRLAAGGPYPRLAVWSVPSGELQQTFDVEGRLPTIVRLSPDGERIACAFEGGGVKVWNATSGALEHTLAQDQPSATRLAFAPDGRELAAALTGGKLVLWNLATGETSGRLEHQGAVSALRWLRDGRTLALAGFDGSFELWDRGGAAASMRFEGHTQSVNAIASTASGELLATAGQDGLVRIWSPLTSATLATLDAGGGPVVNLGFEPDGRGLWSCRLDGRIGRFDLALIDRFIAANAPGGLAYSH
jgi:WD40 repeat protein/predicted Ser/Thr protein kinase